MLFLLYLFPPKPYDTIILFVLSFVNFAALIPSKVLSLVNFAVLIPSKDL